MSLYVRYQSSLSGGGGGGGGGVTSLNTLTGALTLTGGTDVTITPSGTSINIALTIGNLTDVGTDGITITGGTGAVLGSGTSISQHVADSTHNGYLSSTDWSTFNSKQPALTLGNLTDAGTDGITVTNGTGAVIGTGTSLSQHVADTTHNGYLSSTDWNTFNGKQAALTLGNLTAGGPDGISIGTGTGAVVGSGTTVSQQKADATHSGYLSLTDWNTFDTAATTVSSATPLDTSSTLVERDSSGNFAAAIITATLNGNATNVSGVVAATNGGTGESTYTTGDTLYASATNTLSKLPVGTTGQVLTVAAGVPSWATPGAVTFTAPTMQIFVSGSGTYTTPTSPAPLYIEIEMVGGGGGGASASGNAVQGGSGGDGTDTTFGTSLLVAGAGLGAVGPDGMGDGQIGGAGGSSSLGSGPVGIALTGASGGPSQWATTATDGGWAGGPGASSPFGGAGGAGGWNANGQSASANTGSGGGGGGIYPYAQGFNQFSGSGGGAGGYVKAIITSPVSTYAYTVGSGGAGGTYSGSASGGDGAAGIIIVTEYYQ